jgi:hypothetical protein
MRSANNGSSGQVGENFINPLLLEKNNWTNNMGSATIIKPQNNIQTKQSANSKRFEERSRIIAEYLQKHPNLKETGEYNSRQILDNYIKNNPEYNRSQINENYQKKRSSDIIINYRQKHPENKNKNPNKIIVNYLMENPNFNRRLIIKNHNSISNGNVSSGNKFYL